MSEEAVSGRIVTVPNLISFVRLAAIPYFWWLVLSDQDIAAGTIVYVIVACTDWLDGFLARRLGQVTRLGKALDPVADRLMIASALVIGLIAGIVPAVIAWALIAREVYMAAITLTLAGRGEGTLAVRRLGKLATLVVYSSVGWFYMAAVPFLEGLVRPLAWVAGVVGLALYWLVAFQYTGDARRILSRLESSPISEESA
ncbi:MAG TPA: CDP-alcohol phosphatidyltransferase family protein [Acidimicrobiia bacterium]|nr:CDP-alcohol phosphatidyltransferase family protein [Acidimicrobiia bacterium]